MPPKQAVAGSWASKKHFCDDCGHWIHGTRDIIRNHMNTPQHKQKHERRIREMVAQGRRDRGVAVGDLSELGLKMTAAEQKKNEKKAKQEEFLKKIQEQVEKKRESDAALLSKHKPVSYRDRMQSTQGKQKVWEIEIDDETGKACFVNKMTGERKFEVPFGLELSPSDEEVWEEAQMVDWRQMPDVHGLNTKIGEWEEVAPEETFLSKYAAKDEATPGTRDANSQDLSEESDESDQGPESVLYEKNPDEEMHKKYVQDQNDKFDKVLEESGGSISRAMDSLFTHAKDKSKLLVELAKRGIEVFDDEPDPNEQVNREYEAHRSVQTPNLEKPGVKGNLFKKKGLKSEIVKNNSLGVELD